jgi:hypothetical protein
VIIYKLAGPTFERDTLLEEYESCVWAERWIEPGDFRLVVPATHDNAVFLRPGSMLENEESREPMLIETRDIQDGMITATGKTVESFFNERYVGPMFLTDWSDPNWSSKLYKSVTLSGPPPQLLRDLIAHMQLRDANLNTNIIDDPRTNNRGPWEIPGLRLGVAEAVGETVKEKLEQIERAHDVLMKLAKKYSIGISVVLADKEGFPGERELVFNTRVPVDRTLDNADYVRFSPRDDNFSNIREMWSVVDEVNFTVVRAPNWMNEWWDERNRSMSGPRMYPNPNVDPDLYWDLINNPAYRANPFGSRLREFDGEFMTKDYMAKYFHEEWLPQNQWFLDYHPWITEDTTTDDLLNGSTDGSPFGEIIPKIQIDTAKAKWLELNHGRNIAFDGEVESSVYKYGRDYQLGDRVEVEANFTGGRRPMVVSEYIRSLDGTGKREYPTVAQPSTSPSEPTSTPE